MILCFLSPLPLGCTPSSCLLSYQKYHHPPTTSSKTGASLVSSSNMSCPPPQLLSWKPWEKSKRDYISLLSVHLLRNLKLWQAYLERLTWIFLLPLDCHVSQHRAIETWDYSLSKQLWMPGVNMLQEPPVKESWDSRLVIIFNVLRLH
jgi:hypothetical protein